MVKDLFRLQRGLVLLPATQARESPFPPPNPNPPLPSRSIFCSLQGKEQNSDNHHFLLLSQCFNVFYSIKKTKGFTC